MPAGALDPLLGVWVGGRGRRMGGVQKALLRTPDGTETLLERLLRVARAAGIAEVVLVGRAELGEVARGLAQLPDTTSGIGPLGGLAALLDRAGERPALALACDMPYVSAQLLARLARAPRGDAQVLAARDPASGKWQPLFARYDASSVGPQLTAALAAGETSFQALFRRLHAVELRLSAEEHAQLRDWDRPEDMRP